MLLLLTLAGCTGQPVQQRQFLQFGTLIDISISGIAPAEAEAAFDAIEALLARRNRQWHAWADGDLKRFNDALAKQPAEGVRIPPSLRRLISDSKRYYRISEGLFNPALGRLIAAWGFQADQKPDPALIERIRGSLPTMDQLRIEGDRAWSENPYLQLDFGAIAKGLAIEQISHLLQQRGIDNFIINAGGDLLVRGRKDDGSPWIIGIEDPFEGGALATLKMTSNGAVFTSGSYRRFYIDGQGRRRQHIIDPRSGEPATRLRSATVLHDDPVAADVAATTLMLADPDRLGAVMQAFGLKEALVITEQRQARVSPGWGRQLLWRENAGIQPVEIGK
jgi:thiamine biosynthesis lipoprotein